MLQPPHMLCTPTSTGGHLHHCRPTEALTPTYLRTKDLNPLIVSVGSLPTVVHGHHDTVLERQDHQARVNVAGVPNFRVHLAATLAVHLGNLGPDQEASDVEVVHRHIVVEPPRHLQNRNGRFLHTYTNTSITFFVGIEAKYTKKTEKKDTRHTSHAHINLKRKKQGNQNAVTITISLSGKYF